MSKILDVEFVRSNFPAFQNNETKNLAFFENAGGTYVPNSVITKLNDFMITKKVQPYGNFTLSKKAGDEMDRSINKISELLNIEPDEFIVGPSTTMNMFLLSNAIMDWLNPGDEIIVTNQDHEANIGAWRKLSQYGIVVKEWSLNKDSAELELENLKSLLTEKTKLLSVCHTSNIVASINNLKEIVNLAHSHDAKVIGDGVAYMAHDLVEIKDINIDFYAFSFYKTFGPHMALLYGKKELLKKTKNLNHEFLSKEIPLTLNPGGPNHEELACLSGLTDYYEGLYNHHFTEQKINLHKKCKEVFKLIYNHEEQLMEKLLNFLKSKKNIKLVGKTTHLRSERMPTVSFTVKNKSSLKIAQEAGKNEIGIGNGNFYAWRCLKGLGINENDGVVRVSMVHYNNLEEINKLINFFDANL